MTITQIKQLTAIHEEREQLKYDLFELFELFRRNRLRFETHLGIPPMRFAIEFLQATATLFGGTYNECDRSVDIPLSYGIYVLISKKRMPTGKIILALSPKVRLYEVGPTAITEEDIYQMNEETRLERGDSEEIGEISTKA